MMKILVVDDDEVTRNLLTEVLSKEGFAPQTSASAEDALLKLKREGFPLVLSDVRMVKADGLALLKDIKRVSKETVVVLMTGFGSMTGAVEAMQAGAFDYVSKPFKIPDLLAVLKRARDLYQAQKNRAPSSEAITPAADAAKKALIGKSPKIVEVYRTLAKAALSESNVLLVGEHGTGKELVARSIHENSSRRKKLFAVLSLGGLAESEAETQIQIKMREAQEGTVFVDDVASIPVALQARLYRAMDENIFNCRWITASDRNLETLVQSSRFRSDLFYRSAVLALTIPPLRERMEDLPDLVSHFLALFSKKNNKPISHLSEEALLLLRSHTWPGNVRELEQTIERAVALSRSEILYPEDFPNEIRGIAPAEVAEPADSGTSLEQMERAHILRVLQETGFNKTKASEVLGIDRATLYRKAKLYGISLRKS